MLGRRQRLAESLKRGGFLEDAADEGVIEAADVRRLVGEEGIEAGGDEIAPVGTVGVDEDAQRPEVAVRVED